MSDQIPQQPPNNRYGECAGFSHEDPEFYRLAAEMFPDPIVITDLDSNVLTANRRAAITLGFESADELEGRSVFEFMAPEDHQPAMESSRKALELGSVRDVGSTLLRKDGSRFPGELTVSVVRNAQGMLKGFWWVVRDVAGHQRSGEPPARRGADEALRESEERYRTLVEMAPDAIFIRRDDEDWEFLYINPEGARIFGAAGPEEMLGRPLLSFLHPDSREEVAATFRRFRDEGQAYYRSQGRLTRLDGQVVEFEASTSPIHVNGEMVRHVLMSDVTERNRLEEQLNRFQKMEALGALSAGLVHYVNNSLTAIMGSAQIGKSSLGPDAPQRDQFEQIEQAAQRTADLTGQLLAFCRGQFTSPGVLELNGLIRDIHDVLRGQVKESVELVVLSGNDLGLVRIDPRQFAQVIINLVVNAVYAMPAGGKVVIETANVSHSRDLAAQCPSLQPGNYVMLKVTDTGVGMSPEVLEHIFEPFFTTKEVGRGSGLGLSACYGIVRQSGGHIAVESVVGVGSTFRIYLPQVQESAGANPSFGGL